MKQNLLLPCRLHQIVEEANWRPKFISFTLVSALHSLVIRHFGKGVGIKKWMELKQFLIGKSFQTFNKSPKTLVIQKANTKRSNLASFPVES